MISKFVNSENLPEIQQSSICKKNLIPLPKFTIQNNISQIPKQDIQAILKKIKT